MGNYRDLRAKMNELEGNRILIMDNNNLEFCSQHDDIYSSEEVFKDYDIILIPEWVHREISHSQKQLHYLASVPIPYFIVSEEEDYPELVGYQELRLLELFHHASSATSPARKFYSKLKKFYHEHDDLPESWIEDFYELKDLKSPVELI